MVYINKRTTLVLFLLLIMSIIFFGAAVVYYQQSLTKLNDDIRDKRVELDTLTTKINKISSNLSMLSETLDVQVQREENLSGQFINLKDEKDLVEDQKKELEIKFEDTKDELIEAKIDIENLEDDINELIVVNSYLNETLEDVLDDVGDVCDDIHDLYPNLNITDCQDYT